MPRRIWNAFGRGWEWVPPAPMARRPDGKLKGLEEYTDDETRILNEWLQDAAWDDEEESSITRPPEMLPRAGGPADVIVVNNDGSQR